MNHNTLYSQKFTQTWINRFTNSYSRKHHARERQTYIPISLILIRSFTEQNEKTLNANKRRTAYDVAGLPCTDKKLQE